MITIIEDLVDVGYQNYIRGIVENSQLPLFWNKATTYGTASAGRSVTDPNTKEDYQLTHIFLRDNKPLSELWSSFSPISAFLMARTGVGTGNDVLMRRAKLNVNPRMAHYKKNEYFTPHLDIEGAKGITAIYYLNDADGDTLFFENPKEPEYANGNVTIPYELKVIERIRPKQGTLVYFDNSILHSGQPPQESSYRSVINLNWIKV
jgi:hypothetical protein